MSKFFFGLLIGAALMYGAMHYHFVRGEDGVFMVPKVTNELRDVYVDIRSFTLEDWKLHKPLAAAIMKSDRSELLADSTLAGFRDNIDSLVERLFSSE